MPVALEPLCIQIPQFDLARTLDCGQAFRWSRLENGAFHGVAFGWPLTIWQEGEQIFFSCSQEVFDQIWFSYFDLKRDYSALCERFRADAVMRQALDACPGIRILHQEPWEAICSFIISQTTIFPASRGSLGGYANPLASLWAVETLPFRLRNGLRCWIFQLLPPCGLDSGQVIYWMQRRKLPQERLASKRFLSCRWRRLEPPCKRFGVWGRKLRNAPCSMDAAGWMRFP